MKKTRFNDDWLFSNQDGSIQKKKVTLPHDAMQTEARIPGLKNGEASGYYPGGTYIYEKELSLSEKEADQTMILEFEGIYQKSKVYLNDQLIGEHIYGYTGFFVDLTGKCNIGTNKLKVIADNSQTPNSRWYTGSGIYRDVYLYTGGREYIRPQGVKMTTKSVSPAVLHVEVDAVKEAGTEIRTEISYKGRVVAEGSDSSITIPNAKLWSSETPELYDVKVSLIRDGIEIDAAQERTGIRQIRVSHDKGFTVNGSTVKLRGGCVHHDHGPLGACSFYNAEVRRVRKMKEAGFNAIRYAHNPAGKAFMDACDEVGMYVMDEAFDMWECKKSDRDYGMYFEQEWEKDLTSMIAAAYNHPSVVMYSIGNEILDIGLPSGEIWSKRLADCCHAFDDTRPVLSAFSPGLTCMAAKGIGINKFEAKPDDVVDPKEVNKDSAASGSKLVNMLITLGPLMMKFIGGPKKMEKLAKGSIEPLDITGYNYGLENYPVHLKHHPDSVLVGSETFNSKIAEHWKYVEENSFMIGEFTWTAWDYLGEAGIGLPRYEGMSSAFSYPYPCITGYCGCFDLVGKLEGQGAHVLAVWNQLEKPYIGVSPVDKSGKKVKMGSWRAMDTMDNWTWPGYEGKKAEVQIYAGKDTVQVELFKNGKSQGRKEMKENMVSFDVTYEPGYLEVVAYDENGWETGRNVLETAGEDSQLVLKPEQQEIVAADKDVAYIDIYIADKKGIVKFNDSHKVNVTVTGAGFLAALGSGNPLTEELYTGNTYTTYNGHVLAIVRANGKTGDIEVNASAEGMQNRQITIHAV